MKGLFIIFEELFEHSGISKKILSQVSGFQKNGIDMEISSLVIDDHKNTYTKRVINGQVLDIFSSNTFLRKLQWRITYNSLTKYILKRNLDFVYIRYIHFANPFFVFFLRKLKQNKVKILLEIPTYPYDMEYVNTGIVQKMILMIERYSRRRLKNYVNKIITYSNDEFIFGVPTIRLSNGVDIDDIPHQLASKVSDETINLIGVASLSFWHGFDRVIEGLKIYYEHAQDKEIIFHIVGNDNEESMNYRNLVKTYSLEKYVIFHGTKFGKELDDVFNIAHLGVGCLGCHRKGISNVKSIKNREYCARGLPFVYSEIDDDFEDKNFVMKIPPDENPVDIQGVLNFIETNRFNRYAIRNYAKEYLTWTYQIKKVIPHIK